MLLLLLKVTRKMVVRLALLVSVLVLYLLDMEVIDIVVIHIGGFFGITTPTLSILTTLNAIYSLGIVTAHILHAGMVQDHMISLIVNQDFGSAIAILVMIR